MRFRIAVAVTAAFLSAVSVAGVAVRRDAQRPAAPTATPALFSAPSTPRVRAAPPAEPYGWEDDDE